MSLSLQEIAKNGMLDELATVFNRQEQATLLLTRLGFPARLVPQFNNPPDFWLTVCTEISNGALRNGDGLQSLVDEAFEMYQGNDVFARHYSVGNHNHPHGSSQALRQTSIVVQGSHDAADLLTVAQQVAQRLGMSANTVRLGFTNVEGTVLQLLDQPTERGAALARGLEDRLRYDGTFARISVSSSEFVDYLIRQLFVEGPDQARFEINDIRASTPVGDVARAIMGTQYDPAVHGAATGRNTVVDRVGEAGRRERLDPNKSLHEQHIRDGETLSISPESRAGAMNPVYRDEAYARAKLEILEYARSHDGFLVLSNGDTLPTEYEFQFNTPSFAPSSASDTEIVLINEHKVRLILPPDFPMKAPLVMWQTPIFHPNVERRHGKVCLGMLEENYRPGMHFGNLCQMLVDIAAYRNYTVVGVYNSAAALWALSQQGQQAIAAINGMPVSEHFIEDLEDARANGGFADIPTDTFDRLLAALRASFHFSDVEREGPRKLEVHRL